MYIILHIYKIFLKIYIYFVNSHSSTHFLNLVFLATFFSLFSILSGTNLALLCSPFVHFDFECRRIYIVSFRSNFKFYIHTSSLEKHIDRLCFSSSVLLCVHILPINYFHFFIWNFHTIIKYNILYKLNHQISNNKKKIYRMNIDKQENYF